MHEGEGVFSWRRLQDKMRNLEAAYYIWQRVLCVLQILLLSPRGPRARLPLPASLELGYGHVAGYWPKNKPRNAVVLSRSGP